MSRDGRTRESSVRMLASEEDSLVGPFLVLRSVDWVDEVAVLAMSILADRLPKDPAALVASAPLVFALADRQRRSGLTEIVLERATVDASIRAALLASPDRQTRRRLIMHEPLRRAMPLDQLVTLAVSDPDTSVAALAGVAAVARVAAGDVDDVLERLLAGPAVVRAAVLDALPGGERARESAEGQLFDRSPAVRGAAQKAYVRTGGDAAAVYRAAMSRAEHVATAIVELAAIGGEQDRIVIFGALQSPESANRRAAVEAAKWVAGERIVELLVPMLWDSTPSVARAAERRLRGHAHGLDGKVLGALAEAPDSHNRRAAYRLLRRRTMSERVEADLIALADDDPANQRDALADLRSWLSKAAASAPRADLVTRRRLSHRLELVERQLGSDVAKQTRFHAGLRPTDLAL